MSTQHNFPSTGDDVEDEQTIDELVIDDETSDFNGRNDHYNDSDTDNDDIIITSSSIYVQQHLKPVEITAKSVAIDKLKRITRWATVAILIIAITVIIYSVIINPKRRKTDIGRAHIFLIAGQSNAIGFNKDRIDSKINSIDPRIKQLSCCPKGQSSEFIDESHCSLIVASDPLHHNCPIPVTFGVGFGISFARSLLPHLPASDYIILVPSANPGSGFAMTGALQWIAQNHGQFAQRAILKSNMANQLSATSTIQPVFDAILWHQGERDAAQGMKGDTYLNDYLIALIKYLRSNIIGASDKTIFIAGGLPPLWLKARAPMERDIMSGLVALPNAMNYTGFVSSEGLVDPSSGYGVIHFSAADEITLGHRYYERYQQILTNTATKAHFWLQSLVPTVLCIIYFFST